MNIAALICGTKVTTGKYSTLFACIMHSSLNCSSGLLLFVCMCTCLAFELLLFFLLQFRSVHFLDDIFNNWIQLLVALTLITFHLLITFLLPVDGCPKYIHQYLIPTYILNTCAVYNPLKLACTSHPHTCHMHALTPTHPHTLGIQRLGCSNQVAKLQLLFGGYKL